MASATRPYTVLEPRTLHDLAEGILAHQIAPGIAEPAIALLRAASIVVYQSVGEYVAYHREAALRACYREQGSEGTRELAAVAKLRFEPVYADANVRIG